MHVYRHRTKPQLPPAILLRESIREGKKIIKRTIANLSSLTLAQAEAIRAVLKGQTLAPINEIIASRSHGAVQAIDVAMGRLMTIPTNA